MQVSLEVVNSIERRLSFVIPVKQVEDAYTQLINRYAKNANIKGFRPGKAPVSVIQQRYGDEARREAYGEVINNALHEALKENKLNPVSTPNIEPKVMRADQPFEFVASFEILPSIDKINFSLENIEKLSVDVSQDDITHVVEQLKKQYTKWNSVEREAKKGDRLVIDYYMIFDGKPDLDNKIQHFPLELGSNVMLPGFEDGLLGVKVNEERTLTLTFPTDFPVEERAGKAADFVITVKQILEADAPSLDEAFIKRLGIQSGSEQDLHKQIRQSLELERDRLLREKQKEHVFKALLEQNPIEVPKAMVAREAKNIHDEIYAHDKHHEHNHSEQEMASFNDVASKRVALGLLISEYAKQNQVKPDADRVAKRVHEIASIYENPQEVAAWLLSEEKRSGIDAQVLEDQVIEKLMEGVSVIEKTISYAELKGIRV